MVTINLPVDLGLDPRRQLIHDRVRVAEAELQRLALHLGAVADADDLAACA
jgi:hypothetical protein